MKKKALKAPFEKDWSQTLRELPTVKSGDRFFLNQQLLMNY